MHFIRFSGIKDISLPCLLVSVSSVPCEGNGERQKEREGGRENKCLRQKELTLAESNTAQFHLFDKASFGVI